MTVEKQNATGTYPIRAVDRVCDLLDTLANSPSGASLSELAASAHMPKSSAFRYLMALEARQYVERDADDGSFRLGLAFRHRDTDGMERLRRIAMPELERLREASGETANLAVLDGDQVVHTLVAESHNMMRLAARVGERGYVHCTALGKAICARLPEARVRAILASSGTPAFTEYTITDHDEYLKELQRVRQDGYGMDDAENQLRGRCVAVAIDGMSFPAAVSISAPSDRLPVEAVPVVVRQLQRAATAIGQAMGV